MRRMFSSNRPVFGLPPVILMTMTLSLGSPALLHAQDQTGMQGPQGGATGQVNADPTVASADPFEKRIEMARVLYRGRRYSDDNPLLVIDREAAVRDFDMLLEEAPSNRLSQIQLIYGSLMAGREEAEDIVLAVSLLEKALENGEKDAAVPLAEAILAKEQMRQETISLKRIAGLLRSEIMDGDGEAILLYGKALSLAGRTDEGLSYQRQAYALMLARTADRANYARFLGLAFRDGDVLDRDDAKAILYLRKAADRGSRGAANELVGVLQGMGASPSTMGDALELSVSLGSSRSAVQLLDDYVSENRFETSPERAMVLARHLTEIGEPSGYLYQMALFTDDRYSLKRSDAIVAAASRGLGGLAGQAEPAALAALGRAVLSFDLPQEIRIPLALDIFGKAAKKGDVQSAYLAGRLIFDRRPGSSFLENRPDLKERGEAYLLKAAEGGVQAAMLQLGEGYFSGRDVPLDLDKAERWLIAAVETNDNPRALEQYSDFLLTTRNDAVSDAKAIALLERAVVKGSERAMTRLGKLFYSGRDTFVRDPLRGLEYLERAAERDHPDALITLGNIALETIPPDHKEAERRFQEAIEVGGLAGYTGLSAVAESRGDIERAIQLAEEGTEALDPETMVRHARLLREHREGSEAKVLELLEKAETLGFDDSRALRLTAMAFLDAGDPSLSKRGVKDLEILAARGYRDAYSELVNVHLDGRATGEIDLEGAISWARAGLDRRIVDPMIRIANVLDRGTDETARDAGRAIALLEEAQSVSRDSASVSARLGAAYLTGDGVERNEAKGFEYIKEAATRGNVGAQLRLAKAHIDGLGTPRDVEAGLRWYREAEDRGSLRALLDLGRLFASGGGNTIEPEMAFVYFYRAAEAGSVDAMVEVGRSLLAGFGIMQDEALGIQWLEKAADAGSIRAMGDLFDLYMIGDRPDDRATALRWLRRAADAGGTEAMFRYAIHLRNEADGKNSPEAINWLKKAAGLGHKYSERILQKGWQAYTE